MLIFNLPSKLQKLAISNIPGKVSEKDTISGSFCWASTKEGYHFWKKINEMSEQELKDFELVYESKW